MLPELYTPVRSAARSSKTRPNSLDATPVIGNLSDAPSKDVTLCALHAIGTRL